MKIKVSCLSEGGGERTSLGRLSVDFATGAGLR